MCVTDWDGHTTSLKRTTINRKWTQISFTFIRDRADNAAN